MEIQTLLPIVGVVIGWLLKELSDAFRQRSQDRKEIGTALVGLLQLQDELRRLKTYQEYFKDRAGDWQKYERFRLKTAKRYLTRTDPAVSVQTAIAVLGSRHPLDAVGLRDISVMLAYYHTLDLDRVFKDDATYVKSLSMLEVVFDMSDKFLKALILKLAWLHGPFTYGRVRLSWWRHKSKLAAKNREFGTQLLDELLNEGREPEAT